MDGVPDHHYELIEGQRQWANGLSRTEVHALLEYQGVAGYGDELNEVLERDGWQDDPRFNKPVAAIDSALAAVTLPLDVRVYHGFGYALHGDETWEPEHWLGSARGFRSFLSTSLDPWVATSTYGYQALGGGIRRYVVATCVVPAGMPGAYLPVLRTSEHAQDKARFFSEFELLLPRGRFALRLDEYERASHRVPEDWSNVLELINFTGELVEING